MSILSLELLLHDEVSYSYQIPDVARRLRGVLGLGNYYIRTACYVFGLYKQMERIVQTNEVLWS